MMKQVALSLLTLAMAACTHTPDAMNTEVPLSPGDLVGTWEVALYFSPDSPPSSTVMKIDAINPDGTLSGSFYQSPFETGRYTEREGVVVISVMTSDGSGPYATSGRLVTPDRIEGQTLSTGRGFLMTWTATKP